ncbi:MAG: dTDP-4-dehydrorhamnose 3,5-epimerase [Pseudomonadota bacterium]|nr:dTDP-4-dehydrorhamnose 3,5-epimerase [Pseudomonadota bacterium]
MKFIPTAIPDVVLIEPVLFEDERGWFMESFNERTFHGALRQLGLPIPRPFVQDNHSCSHRGVLRGLHYQLPPRAQGKLVRVVKGAAFDVAVDIRVDSATFGQHVAVELSAANHCMLWIPEGFAHGFVALEDDTHFLYKTTDFYARECEAAIRWDDPDLAIDWPMREALVINAKDGAAPLVGNPGQ